MPSRSATRPSRRSTAATSSVTRRWPSACASTPRISPRILRCSTSRRRRRRPPPPSNVSIPIPPEVFLYLLVAVLAIALCIVAYHLYGTYAFGRRVSKKKVDQPLQVATQPIMRPAGDAPLPDLDEIERLARAGAFAEAIHLMLLRALEALRHRLGTSWAKSLTSREIARRSELAPTDRSALKMLVGAVEISRFGGKNANEQIYRACLDQYRLIGESGMARA